MIGYNLLIIFTFSLILNTKALMEQKNAIRKKIDRLTKHIFGIFLDMKVYLKLLLEEYKAFYK